MEREEKHSLTRILRARERALVDRFKRREHRSVLEREVARKQVTIISSWLVEVQAEKAVERRRVPVPRVNWTGWEVVRRVEGVVV